MTAVEGWEHAEKVNKETGGGKFIRLKGDGDNVVGVFCGQPITKQKVWNEKTEQSEDYDETLHGKDARKSPKFSFNFFCLAEQGKPLDPPAMKIIEFNNTGMSGVVANKGKYGMEKMVYEVKRSGAKNDTKAFLHVMPEGPKSPFVYSDAIAKLISEAKLHDLKAVDDAEPAQTNGAGHTNGAGQTGADPVIDKAQCDAFIVRLKACVPHKSDAVEAFCLWADKSLGTRKVKEFRASQLKTAEAYIATMEPAPAASAPAATNPWD